MKHQTSFSLSRAIGTLVLLVVVLAASLAVTWMLVGPLTSAQAAAATVNGKIAFSSSRDGSPEIYTMNAHSSARKTRLTDIAGNVFQPAWSPDGTKIAFTAGREIALQIYTMNADGSDENILASGWSPSWSPDGTKIAYSSIAYPSQTANSASIDRPLSRSSDSSKNVFASEVEGWFIYKMNADGSDQVALTAPDKQDAYAPAWSHSGMKISFVWSGFELSYGTFKMNADGTGLKKIKYLYNARSPNGKKIVFVKNGRLYTKNVNGSGKKRLTGRKPLPVVWNPWNLSWSPDSKKIVFVRGDSRGNNYEIYTINANGSHQRRLTRNTVVDDNPAWQPLPRP